MTEGTDDETLARQLLAHLTSRPDVLKAEPVEAAVFATKADGTEYVFYVEHVRAQLAASPGRPVTEVITEIADVVLRPPGRA